MLHASGCYLVEKSYQDHRGSQSEQFLTLVTFFAAERLPPVISDRIKYPESRTFRLRVRSRVSTTIYLQQELCE